ncbi:MAG TPA: protein phosphatase 2C domain-containing protein [Herpetosiphonaceae bacterium]|nr:protein phosphatase 2C domain-containing protein [Herpetosiphonaceae bacterium]
MSAHSTLELHFAHRSDRGYARRINEDTSAAEDIRLFDGRSAVLAAIADGIGGARAGAEASQIAVTTAFSYLRRQLRRVAPRDEAQWKELLAAALRAANAAVHARATTTNRATMGTTLIVTVAIGRRAYIAHVGDCRAYAVRPAVRKPHITQLTVEHTVVAELVGQGALSYAEANGHPQRHQLARAVGAELEVEPEVAARTLRASERLVLCSDGVPLHLSDTDIARTVSDAPSPEEACDALIALANARGGRDNLSAVVIAAAPPNGAEPRALQLTSEA